MESAPVSARAPTQRDDLAAEAQAVISADFQLGPFFLQPRIASSAGYQSVGNFRQEDDPTKAQLDFRVNVTPGLGLALPIKGRHMLSFSPRAQYTWWLEFKELQGFSVILPGSYVFSSPRVDVTLRGTYVDGWQGAQDPILVDGAPANPDFEDNDYYQFTSLAAGGSVGLRLSRRKP